MTLDPRSSDPSALLALGESAAQAAGMAVDDERGHRVVLARLLYRNEGGAPPLRGVLWEAHTHLREGPELSALDAALDLCGEAPVEEIACALHPRLLGERVGARRSGGVFYTPGGTARWLVAQALEGLAPEEGRGWQIADPCCGCGAFLMATLDVLAARGELERLDGLYGIDVDPAAVEIARLRLMRRLGGGIEAAQIAAWVRVDDGLSAALPPLDAVVSNPPFGNAIEADTSRSDDQRARHRALLPEVARGAYDLSVLFAARAAERLRPGGRYALVVPRSLLSVASAEGMRAFLSHLAPPHLIWAPAQSRLFKGADVFVALICGERGEEDGAHPIAVGAAPRTEGGGPDSPLKAVPGPAGALWMPLLLPERALLQRVARGPVAMSSLGALFELHGGAATGAAYDLKPLVEDSRRGKGPPLVTTGLIDRYTCFWGQRPCRYLGTVRTHPRWPGPGVESPRSVQRAMSRQATPKVLVGGLSRVLEAVADPEGALAGVVSTWVVRPRSERTDDLWLLEALLNAPVLSLIYMTRFSGKEMSGGNTTVGRRELASLEVPADLLDLSADPAARAPGTPWTCFDLDPGDPTERGLLARWAVEAVKRVPGTMPGTPRDALAAACLARLYGQSREDHEATLRWFKDRGGIVLNTWEEP